EKTTARAVDVAIAAASLLAHVELERRDEVQIALRARHRNVEKPPLLVDQLRAAGREFRGETAVGNVQHVHGIPLLPLRGGDRGQHEPVLVEVWRSREIARGLWRVERQLCQKLLAGPELL